MVRQVIWDVMAPIMTSLLCNVENVSRYVAINNKTTPNPNTYPYY